MTFLPLVERELRVASRRQSTFWLRGGMAIAALACILPALLVESFHRSPAAPGTIVFLWLSYCAFALCLLTGAFLAADCISLERREGTLGFLFLTDLKGYDVVLGKFSAVSLLAFYGLLAILPILGLSLLAGGVTFAEFWRMDAALLNALFFATSLSICVSARVRSASTPTMLALGLLIAISLGGISAFNHWSFTNFRLLSCLSMLSPSIPFALAPAPNYLSHQHQFWLSLLLSNVAGWLCLLLAAWRLDIVRDNQSKPFFARFRKRRRRSLLAANPIAWLLDDSPGLRHLAWAVAFVGALVAFLRARDAPLAFWWGGVGPFCGILKVLIAVQACRFFAESRRNGALELLAATGISGREIVSGQWIALRRIFLPPICLLFGATLLSLFGADDIMGAIFSYLGLLWLIATQSLDFLTIAWFGMWMGLSLRQPNRAAFVTVLVAIVIPLILFCVPNFFIDILLLAIAQYRISRWQDRPYGLGMAL